MWVECKHQDSRGLQLLFVFLMYLKKLRVGPGTYMLLNKYVLIQEKAGILCLYQLVSSVQFSHSVVSDSATPWIAAVSTTKTYAGKKV